MPGEPQPAGPSAEPRQKIGFVLNPIAGMGGRVGLKGTDGPEVLEEAFRRGAKAQAHERALYALRLLARHTLWKQEAPPLWLTCGGPMGAAVLEEAGYGGELHRIVYFPSETGTTRIDPATGELVPPEGAEKARPAGTFTSALDTHLAVKAMVKEGAQLIVFCGGDGTARDVLNALQGCRAEGLGPSGVSAASGVHRQDEDRSISSDMGSASSGSGPVRAGGGGPEAGNIPATSVPTPTVPVVGLPAGVKMHSAVFGTSPAAAAELVELYLTGRAGLREAEVMDVDEAAFRDNRLAVKLHGHLRVPYHADLLQGCKCLYGGEDEQEAQEGIIENLQEKAQALREAGADTLWLLGPGSTVARIKAAFGIEQPTILGVDAMTPDTTIHHDVDEQALLRLLEAHPQARLIVSPIGAQGFLFGRGNQQFSPSVLASVGREHLQVVASPHKLRDTPRLLLDTGDPELDEALSGFYKVMIGYHVSRMTRVEAAR